MKKLRSAIEICRHCCGQSVTGAEIGVLGGGHAGRMLRNWPELTMLHLVDSYGGMSTEDPRFLKVARGFEPHKGRIKWHVMTSVEAAKTFDDESLDFVYIDANHEIAEVKADMSAWWPRVKIGGVLCGHDYFSNRGVKKAVDEWAAERNHFVFSTDPDWWIFRE